MEFFFDSYKKKFFKFVTFFVTLLLSFNLFGEERFIEIPLLYNFQAPYNIDKWDTLLTIGHRSNVGISATDNLLGLDAGLNVQLSVDLGLPYNTSVGISRSSTRLIYNIHGKYTLHKCMCPINHAFAFSLSLPRSDGYEKDLKYNFAFISSKILFSKLEVIVPLYFTLFSNDLINVTAATEDHTFTAGLGLRYGFNEEIFGALEFAYPVWGYKNYAYYLEDNDWLPTYSLSIQYKPTYTHILQLGISNTTGMVQEEYLGGGDKEFRVGFTFIKLF